MRKVIIFFVIIAIAGCATTTGMRSHRYNRTAAYVEVGRFCKEHNLQYQFDTIDDLIHLTSSDKDIRLLLNSSLVYYNGAILTLKAKPFYSEGRIYLPRGLERMLTRKVEPVLLPLAISIKRIVIDPGHGGKDPGAVSRRGLKEKDVNLKVSKYLKAELEKRGFSVYLTRSSDKYLTLRQRVEIARTHKADLFISVHANANRSRKVRGLEVYFLARKYFDNETKVIAAAENAPFNLEERKIANSATRRILWDLTFLENNAESVEFANVLYGLFKKLGFKVRPPRGAPFYVLKYAYVPSVLVETGYLTNVYEEKLLRKTSYQKQIAEAIAMGVVNLNNHYARLSKTHEVTK